MRAKLVACIQKEEQVRAERDELARTVTNLRKENSLLSSLVDQQTLDRIDDLKKVANRSFKQGSNFVVDEVHKLWTSTEYAAELMFGMNFENKAW